MTQSGLHRGVDHPEVVLECPDGVFGDTATQPMVGLDLGGAEPLGGHVGDDRVQPPAVKIVEGQLLTAPFGLAAHDQPHTPPQRRGGGLGDLAALARSSSEAVITGCGTACFGLASTTSSTSNNKPVAFTTRVPFLWDDRRLPQTRLSLAGRALPRYDAALNP
jgi:hypothetical protein